MVGVSVPRAEFSALPCTSDKGDVMEGWELGLYILTAIAALISVASLAATPRPQAAPVEDPRKKNRSESRKAA